MSPRQGGYRNKDLDPDGEEPWSLILPSPFSRHTAPFCHGPDSGDLPTSRRLSLLAEVAEGWVMGLLSFTGFDESLKLLKTGLRNRVSQMGKCM